MRGGGAGRWLACAAVGALAGCDGFGYALVCDGGRCPGQDAAVPVDRSAPTDRAVNDLGGDGAACAGGTARCGASCARLDNDPSNCGACGRSCPSGQQCALGGCRAASACDGGAVGMPCTAGGAGCQQVGVSACVDGVVVCNATPIQDGRSPCGVPAGGVCGTGGVCACRVGEISCGGECVDISREVRHCGACERACLGGARCIAGNCTCGAGSYCGGVGCVDTQSSALHCGACGNGCADAGACMGGSCCDPPRARCAGACVDTRSDPRHCGRCGAACGLNEACVAGSCQCDDGYIRCGGGGACVDPQNDADHCGNCSTRCLSRVCVAGRCTCSDGVVCPTGSVCCTSEGGGICLEPQRVCGVSCRTACVHRCDVSTGSDLCCGAPGQPCCPFGGGRRCAVGECLPSGSALGRCP